MSVRNWSALALCAVASVAAGCNRNAPKSPATPPPAAPTPPPLDLAKVRPNELGHIPVVMYHDVAGAKNTDMFRTPATFRNDLQLLYDKGFFPVNLRDVTANQIDVPAGKSPVVLSFDDARQSQFKLIEKADSYEIDPECAVGILEDFCKTHTDWKPRATFFVLPRSAKTTEPFRQTGLGAQKLQYLIDKGYEIGNHTTLHKSLRPMTAQQIQQELGGALKAIQEEAPKAEVVSFAAPFGSYPRSKALWPLLQKGTYEGVEYAHTGVCLAAWRPTPAPGARRYDPLRIERITPEDKRFGLKYWVDELVSGRMSRYVSDGDPQTVTFPKTEESTANLALLRQQGKKIHAYSLGGAGGAKPIVSSAPAEAPGAGPATGQDAPPPPPKPIVGGG